jgi:hypothetical protein
VRYGERYSRKLMINRVLIIILSVYMLTACVGPEAKKEKLAQLAKSCLKIDDDIRKVIGCLKEKGISDLNKYNNTLNYKSCGAYWGYPMVASCSGLVLEYSEGKLIDYKIWAQLDGV